MIRFPASSIALHHRSTFVSSNVISDGAPSRMRMVRRISFGMTTRPSHQCGGQFRLLSFLVSPFAYIFACMDIVCKIRGIFLIYLSMILLLGFIWLIWCANSWICYKKFWIGVRGEPFP